MAKKSELKLAQRGAEAKIFYEKDLEWLSKQN